MDTEQLVSEWRKRRDLDLQRDLVARRQRRVDSRFDRAIARSQAAVPAHADSLGDVVETPSGRPYFLRFARILKIVAADLHRIDALPDAAPKPGVLSELAFDLAHQMLRGVKPAFVAARLEAAVRAIDPLIEGQPNPPPDSGGDATRYLKWGFWDDLRTARTMPRVPEPVAKLDHISQPPEGPTNASDAPAIHGGSNKALLRVLAEYSPVSAPAKRASWESIPSTEAGRLLRGWKAICEATKLPATRKSIAALQRLNKSSKGPIRVIRRRPEVCEGTLLAFLSAVEERAESARAAADHDVVPDNSVVDRKATGFRERKRRT